MLRALGAFALVAVVAAGCGGNDSSDGAEDEMTDRTTMTTEAPDTADGDGDEAGGTVVDVAAGNPDFSTLVEAVKAAGLVETLSGDGPFTVFAPTNDAFAKIPEDQLDAILADREQLTKILTYHVVPGRILAADLQPSQKVATVQGQEVEITVTDGTATINGANIVTTDIEASNGVIHVIDTVILPPA
jgi:uncharacterized surface protein with fasciclin (FAS1) repeats